MRTRSTAVLVALAAVMLLACVPSTVVQAAPATAENGRPTRTALSSPVVVTGTLAGGTWTKVLSGWGYYSVRYYATTGAAGSRYDCYTPPAPWPSSSGPLPAEITHVVRGYGDCWFYSPVETWYALYPVGPDIP